MALQAAISLMVLQLFDARHFCLSAQMCFVRASNGKQAINDDAKEWMHYELFLNVLHDSIRSQELVKES